MEPGLYQTTLHNSHLETGVDSLACWPELMVSLAACPCHSLWLIFASLVTLISFRTIKITYGPHWTLFAEFPCVQKRGLQSIGSAPIDGG
jgi:hypothetical protein